MTENQKLELMKLRILETNKDIEGVNKLIEKSLYE